MDTKMDIDIGKVPEAHQLSPATEPASIPTLDGWIENLMNCKQLAEGDVQRLCDRVGSDGTSSYARPSSVADLCHGQAREVLQEESNVQPVVGTVKYLRIKRAEADQAQPEMSRHSMW